MDFSDSQVPNPSNVGEGIMGTATLTHINIFDKSNVDSSMSTLSITHIRVAHTLEE